MVQGVVGGRRRRAAGGSGFGEVSQGLASRGLAVSLSLAVGAKNDARISENGGMMML